MRQAVAAHAAGVPNRMHDVIYISEFSRDILTPYFRPQTRWRKVSNGINVTRSPRVPAERNGAFLFVGRLSPEKGAIVFAKAAAVAQAPARIVGDGSESQEIARAYPQAELLGWLPAEGVFAEMERARALVFPSLWYETQGLSVYEALARGVPVIVADGAAARDAVVDGENGLLFRTGDAHDLAAKIAQLADPALVKRMSEAAYARYWSRPTTPETHLEELFAAYGDILRERGAAQTR
jgi:glycosyltransferase involved in cell wall biosynthesis